MAEKQEKKLYLDEREAEGEEKTSGKWKFRNVVYDIEMQVVVETKKQKIS